MIVKTYKVLKGGKLIDGLGNMPIKDSVVVLKNGLIEDVGQEGIVEIPSEEYAEFYDIRGKTIMPGLIDTHTHIQLSKDEKEFDLLKQTVPLKSIKAYRNAKITLESGFTTMRDLGAENLVDLGVRDAINDGVLIGPRILASGYKIMPTGADFMIYPPEISIEGRFTMDSPDEIRKAVRELLAMGVDIIKIMATGRTFRKSSSPNAYALSLEEAKIAVIEAHNQNVKVSAHAHGAKGVKIALEAGCDTLEHGTILDDDDVEFMARNDIYLIPTLSYGKRVEYFGMESGLPEYSVRKAIASRQNRLISFSKALKGGVPIAMGSDAGMPFINHGENAFEIEQLVEAGMTPMQAIVASTYTAAKALGLADSVGTIEKNKIADILILNDDPLKDIKVLQNKSAITALFKDGRIIINNLNNCD